MARHELPCFPERRGRMSRAPRLAASFAASLLGCPDSDPATATGGGGGLTVGGSPSVGGSTSGPSAPSSGTTGGPLPDDFTVDGIVVDEAGTPVPGALVLQGGGEIQAETDADGSFSLSITQSIAGIPTAVAAKVGYRSAGFEFTSLADIEGDPLILAITRINPPDNTSYTFGNPGGSLESNNTSQCAHCHTTIALQFETSAHDRSTRNPKLQDLYAGVATNLATAEDCAAASGVQRVGTLPGQPGTSALRCYVGAGVLPDLNSCGDAEACDDPSLADASKPTNFGACADCHAIAMDGSLGGRDLLEAEGYAFERGNHCDACHHIRDIDLDAPPGVGGRLIMQRPSEKNVDAVGAPIMQAMFGPYPDVPTPFMGGSYQPKFSTAEFCAGCHEQKQAALVTGTTLDPRFAQGLPIHSTFTEWSEGPFNPSAPCQTCHMPPIESLFSAIDVANEDNAGIVFGFPRKPSRLRSHIFRSPLTEAPGEPRLIDGAANVAINAVQEGTELVVLVDASNIGAGHAIPTGEPMRAIFLTVEMEGCGQTFAPSGGLTIPQLGGTALGGVVGTDLTAAGAALEWPALNGAAAGMSIRAVRPTMEFWDYDGVGLFQGTTLTADEKGLRVMAPLGESLISSVNGTSLLLASDLGLQPGDLVYLVDQSTPGSVVDGAPSQSLAGLPGAVYARVLSDVSGETQVPQHLATTILSDSRIRPQSSQSSTHRFTPPLTCGAATVTARLIYRPHPWALSRQRGWDARDYLIAEAALELVLP